MSTFDFVNEEILEDLGTYRGAWLQSMSVNETLNSEVNVLTERVHEVEENLLRISDAYDNAGWSPLPGEEAREIPLKTVKKMAEVSRALNAVNPFVKRGVNARISYIWGKGVMFDGLEAVKDKFKTNRLKMFSPQAYEELERVLATDGNAFTALPVRDELNGMKTNAFRISLDEIVGSVSNPLDTEEIWYYKREYKVVVTDPDSGEQSTRSEIKWYMSIAYYQKRKEAGKGMPRRWNKHGVEQNFVIQHMAVNKQVGWRWGLPDIAPVIFWAKAYKEYLEDNAMLVKAYSRLAWQVKVPNAQAGNTASATVMRPPQRDPLTGELSSVGGTYVGTTEMSSVAPTGSQVDFNKGSALASAIASGLEVSKVVITSDPGEGNRATAETLDLPTLKAMESRQMVHIERFMEIFEFWGAKVDMNASSQLLTIEESLRPDVRIAEVVESGGEPPKASEQVTVTFPPIHSDSNKDHAAAIGTYVELGVLYKQEARRDALQHLDLPPFKPWWELPTVEDDPAKKEEQDRQDAQSELNAEREKERMENAPSVIPGQGKSGGIAAKGGAMNSANSARDNRKSDSKKS